MDLKRLVREYGTPYSEELGISLKSCNSRELTKWFLASILFAARISEEIAKKTYREFEKIGMTSAERISSAGWNFLVGVIDRGGYVRYDFKTADKLLEVFGNLQKNYKGNLNLLHKEAKDSADLEKKLMALGKGMGPVTVSIFLRDMRPCWEKADPKPTPAVLSAMKKLKIRDLKDFAGKNGLDLVRLEAALVRYAKMKSLK